jgi:hypothetical protein
MGVLEFVDEEITMIGKRCSLGVGELCGYHVGRQKAWRSLHIGHAQAAGRLAYGVRSHLFPTAVVITTLRWAVPGHSNKMI